MVPVGLLDEEMKVVGHHRISDDPDPEKGLELAHERDDEFPLLVTHDEAPVDDTG